MFSGPENFAASITGGEQSDTDTTTTEDSEANQDSKHKFSYVEFIEWIKKEQRRKKKAHKPGIMKSM